MLCVKGGTNVPKLYAVSGCFTKIITSLDDTVNRLSVGEKDEFYDNLGQQLGG